ncbi:MAG: hypothetical protein ACRENE_01335 [Polyangiaceae bacterium]
MVRAISAVRSAPVKSLAWATLGVLGALGAAACSSSSSSGKTSDGGDDSVSYQMPETGSTDDGGGGGGGGDASDAPSCNVPACATYSYEAGTGGFHCTPIGPDPMCDTMHYLVRCLATDPYNNPPMLTASLHCGNSMPTSMSIETEFCCACP